MDQDTPAIKTLKEAKRLIIKVGSALLIAPDGSVNAAWLSNIASDIARLRADGRQVIIVSSGAIAIGRKRLKFLHPGGQDLRLDEKQAAAAAGQAHLIRAYDDVFAPHDIVAAQLLLTLSITEDRRRYLNARATLEALLSTGAIPIINENDTVATTEIRYGDNDRLAAHAAQMAGADLLTLLSDIDGLYTKNPRKHKDAKHIALVKTVTPEIESYAEASLQNGVGTGGMQTKLAAAKLASMVGCATLIAHGTNDGDIASAGPIERLERGARATLFLPQNTKENARRKWIASKLSSKGRVLIDTGAEQALLSGSSLLAVGVIAAHGSFDRGDTVSVENTAGRHLAQGIAAYGITEVNAIKGLRSDDIERTLGYKRRPAVIHRDDLVISEHKKNIR